MNTKAEEIFVISFDRDDRPRLDCLMYDKETARYKSMPIEMNSGRALRSRRSPAFTALKAINGSV